jgi:hypothetical protein
MLRELSKFLVSASLVLSLQRAVWGNEKARSRQIGASSALMSSGFFGLLRNLRSAMRTSPDLDELFGQLDCNRC